ncbi:hypothetical protein ACFORL_12390 [Legionella dresdenensis]|uniref:SecA family profile domain-containing protein n=1 Tax=Legionella dresdenensis TaxID=450200 RepID=A0ABV8CHW7_9GAMM
MYENSILNIKSRVLESLESTLETAWLKAHRDIINKETDKEFQEQKSANLKQYQCDRNHPDAVLYPHTRIYVQARHHALIEPDRESIYNDKKMSYRHTYIEYWTHQLSQRFSDQLDAFQPEEILTNLFKRHPWLENDPSKRYLSTYATLYLNHIFLSMLEQKLHTRINQWEDLNLDQLKNPNTFSWKPLEFADYQAFTELFPISRLNLLYNNSDMFRDYLTLPRTQSSELLDYTLGRIDLYRLLLNNYPEAMRCNLNAYTACPKILPLDMHDFTTMPQALREEAETILLNTSEENAPEWIALHKENGCWTAYVPVGTDIPDTIRHLVRSVIPVNYAENNQLNSLKNLSAKNIWHAVLLGRVLPWLRNNRSTELRTFRNNVPADVLLQNVMENCFCSNQTGEKESLAKAFINRKPMSNQTVAQVLSSIRLDNLAVRRRMASSRHQLPGPISESELLLGNIDELTGIVTSESLLSNFDKKRIVISPDAARISLFHNQYDTAIQAMYLVYQNNLTRLSFSPLDNSVNSLMQDHQRIFRKLVKYNANLQTIIPTQNPRQFADSYAYPMHCAARNRFLKARNPAFVKEAEKKVAMRKMLWLNTGNELVKFFEQHGKDIDLDFINRAIEFKTQWAAESCDYKLKPDDQALWAFLQIAQMGKDGIDTLFESLETKATNWEFIQQEPAPKLACTLDLNGSLATNPVEYINYLTAKIIQFDTYRKGCTPLFSPLSLILPDTLNAQTRIALINLLETLNNRRQQFPEENNEVIFYNIQNGAPDSKELISDLERLANNNFQVVIRIPEWDRDAYKSEENKKSSLKADYRKVQNKILDNQRKTFNRKLPHQTKNVYAAANGTLVPELVIDDKLAKLPQPWDGDDVIYPLTSQTPGIQQQLEQQVEQEFVQEQEQEQEQELEHDYELQIGVYRGSESDLITRYNINEKCRAIWAKIPESIKNKSGYEQETLRQLFSLWVGSEKDASLVIEQMEPAAVQKIMENAPKFRQNLAKDNLPAGFYLSYLPFSQGLVLCFDPKREKEDLYQSSQLMIKHQNPFKIELHQPKPAMVFKGDYRQFSSVTSNADWQQTLWKFMALEDNDQERINNAKAIIMPEHPDTPASDLSPLMQRLDIEQTFKAPGDLALCFTCLASWAKQKGASEDVINALFTIESPTALSEENLKGFGQLFNQYDIQNNGEEKNGSEHWLFIADQMVKTFSAQHLAIWKKRLLDPSKNWSELLEKREVDAVALSITTLKGKSSIFHDIWWKLVDCHGEATGHMRYSQLWYAFQKVIKFCEDRDLELNKDVLFKYLTNTPNFNAQVFLERLHWTLTRAANQLDNDFAMQSILDNIDQIDWTHSGFYYAARYQNYPFWHNDLGLSQLKTTDAGSAPGYTVIWDQGRKLSDPLTHAKRYVNQRAQFSISKYEQFCEALNQCFDSDTVDAGLIRLFTACFTVGSDNIRALNIEQAKSTLEELGQTNSKWQQWLNDAILLDDEIVAHTIKLRFQDMPVFLELLSQSPIQSSIDMYLRTPIDFINACGRAFLCFEGNNAEENVKLLFQYAAQIQDPNATLLTAYPWLITEQQASANWKDPLAVAYDLSSDALIRAELETLLRQLQSINFSNTAFNRLPNTAALTRALLEIAKEPNATRAASKRRAIISDWVNQGIDIVDQESAYRHLTGHELNENQIYLTMKFKPGFKNQNLQLCQTLFKKYIVVEASLDVENQIEKFQRLLIQLDNKTHYNEVGQILGLLIEKAKSGNQTRRYPLTQLTSWINALLEIDTYNNGHYPTNVLREILNDAVSKPNSSLLNRDLLKLREQADQTLQGLIKKITQTPISAQYKHAVSKIAIKYQHTPDLVQRVIDCFVKLEQHKAAPAVLSKFVQVLENICSSVPKIDNLECSRLIKDFTVQITDLEHWLPGQQQRFKTIWEHSQIKLMSIYNDDKVSYFHWHTIPSCVIPKLAKSRMVLVLATQNWDADQKLFSTVAEKLQKLPDDELSRLVEYMDQEPVPSIPVLNKLLDLPVCQTTDGLIHQFETIEQNLNSDGTTKRHYSTTEADKNSLERVLSGIKEKGRGYIGEERCQQLLNLLDYLNAYSQATRLASLPMPQLQAKLDKALSELKEPGIDAQSKRFASARVLACMREILLRKSGKWANHTQMLDLIYAALNNDASLIHQVKTGEGKSIITIMRAAYLALNGYVVDIFSAKESLSRRDHEEFAPMLDALGIQNSYITANSAAGHYKTGSRNGKGAINNLTAGNSALFHSTHIWKGITALDLNPEKRVAFLDEADHVLNEKTQFNYSDNNDSDRIYNLDEWVYRLTYDYYQKNKSKFITNDSGALIVRRNTELKELCKLLQDSLKCSPKQSQFFNKYMVPALSENPDAMKQRDEQLKQLLTAAHIASGLQEGADFCIMPETKTVTGGLVINTRFAKVMIDNQIRHGSTYSDLVHQFLHIRLNNEASEKGEMPDFFVDPNTQIALSQNASYLLKQYYHKIEGCTGTAGDAQDLAAYLSVYDIKNVIKLPTHEPRRVTFKPTQYCKTESDYILSLADIVMANKKIPTLITCEDDIAVKRISAQLKMILAYKEKEYDFSKYIEDTNDSGKAEADVVPLAGRAGSVVISSRMGRGTDIKPEVPEGLAVVRAYASTPRIVKQEGGRGGRNGAFGTCQEIINYAEVEREYNKFDKTANKRLAEILSEQTQHLDNKIKKHKKNGSDKFKWLDKDENPDAYNMYLKTRAVQQLKHEEKQRHEQYLRRKELVMAVLSGKNMELLHGDIKTTRKAYPNLKDAWLECRKQIEAAWNGRLAGKQYEDDLVYEQFFNQANKYWQTLCSKYPALDKNLLTQLSDYSKYIPSAVSATPAPQEQAEPATDQPTPETSVLPNAIKAYQTWIAGAQKHYFSDLHQLADKQLLAIYGKPFETFAVGATQKRKTYFSDSLAGDYNYRTKLVSLELFFNSLLNASRSSTAGAQKLFDTLTEISSHPGAGIYNIPLENVADLISFLTSKNEDSDYDNYLVCLKHFMKQPWLLEKTPTARTPDDYDKTGLLASFVMKTVTTGFVKDDTLTFISNLSEVIYHHYWDKVSLNSLKKLETIFASNPKFTQILASHTNRADLGEIIKLLLENCPQPEKIAHFMDYVSKNIEDELLPSVLIPLFQIHFGDRSHSFTEKYIPEKPTLSAHLDKKQQRDLWHFFRQRQPVDKKSHDELMLILNGQENNEDFNDKLFKPLINLPPFISVEYMLHYSRFKMGKYDALASEACLKEIKQAGDCFTRAMRQHGITNYESWQTRFNKLSPAENQRFFGDAIRHEAINSKTLNGLAKAFIAKRLTQETLATAFITADKIHNISNQATREFCMKQFLTDYVGKPDGAHTQQVLAFKEWLEQVEKSGLLLDQGGLQCLYRQRHNLNNVKTTLKVIQNLQAYQNEIAIDLDDYYVSPNFEQTNRTYLAFFALIKEAEKAGFSLNYLKSLKKACFTSRSIRSVEQLNKVLEIARLAQEDLVKHRQYGKYFSQLNQGQAARKEIMQFLHHGYLNLDAGFQTRCYHSFEQMAAAAVGIKNFQVSDCGGLQKQLQQTMRLVKEIQQIAAHPFGRTPETPFKYVTQEERKQISDKHNAFFNQQRKSYADMWFTNSARKLAAANLFNTIESESTRMKRNVSNIATYYNTQINTILDTQKEIMDQDSLEKNTKGYSRLFNICTHMFTVIAADYMANSNISYADKADLKNRISEQLVNTVRRLGTKLPESYIGKWNVIRANANNITEVLGALDRKKIPTSLKYIVDNIDGLSALLEQPDNAAAQFTM